MSILNVGHESSLPFADKTLIYYFDRCRVNSAAQHRALICNPLSVRRLLINYFPRICSFNFSISLSRRLEPKARSAGNKCERWSFYLVHVIDSAPWRRRSIVSSRRRFKNFTRTRKVEIYGIVGV